MRFPIVVVLFVVGATLLISGFVSSESTQSTLTKLFTGLPTERSQWLLIGGAAAIVLGLIISLRRPLA